MRPRELPMSERLHKSEMLKCMQPKDRPDPFVATVFEITFLGAVGTMIGMAAIGSMLGQ